MEATRYRHIANKTILRAPELHPGASLGMVTQFDHPAFSSWVTMELVENEKTGLEEIRGLDCDGLDESVMTLQMCLVREEDRAEEVRLIPGTYRELAYAETLSPDDRHTQWRLLECRCGERRDYYLAQSWRLTEVDSGTYDLLSRSLAALESLMTNTPGQDTLDPMLLHVGDAKLLSRSEAAEWLRTYKRPIPAHIDPERTCVPPAHEQPEDVATYRPDCREYAMKTTLRMEMEGKRVNLKAGTYRILGGSSFNEEDGTVVETTLVEFAGNYLLAEQHLDLEAMAGMSMGGTSNCAGVETDYVGVAREIEPEDAAEWLAGHGKAMPVELESHLLGEDLEAVLREKKARREERGDADEVPTLPRVEGPHDNGIVGVEKESATMVGRAEVGESASPLPSPIPGKLDTAKQHLAEEVQCQERLPKSIKPLGLRCERVWVPLVKRALADGAIILGEPLAWAVGKTYERAKHVLPRLVERGHIEKVSGGGYRLPLR